MGGGQEGKVKDGISGGTTNTKGFLKIHMEIYCSRQCPTRHLLAPSKFPSTRNGLCGLKSLTFNLQLNQ